MATYTDRQRQVSSRWLGTVRFPNDADDEWVRGGSTIITRNMSPRGYNIKQSTEEKITVKFTISAETADAQLDTERVIEDWNDCVGRAARFDPENLGIESILDNTN